MTCGTPGSAPTVVIDDEVAVEKNRGTGDTGPCKHLLHERCSLERKSSSDPASRAHDLNMVAASRPHSAGHSRRNRSHSVRSVRAHS